MKLKLAVVLSATVALSACTVSGDEVLAAQAACEPYGGVNYVAYTPEGDLMDARCNDGTNVFGPIESHLKGK